MRSTKISIVNWLNSVICWNYMWVSELHPRWSSFTREKVCDNVGDHLIGNVYARYEWETEAQAAVDNCNERWYAGMRDCARSWSLRLWLYTKGDRYMLSCLLWPIFVKLAAVKTKMENVIVGASAISCISAMPLPNLFDNYDTVRDSSGNYIHHNSKVAVDGNQASDIAVLVRRRVVVEMARIDGQGREIEYIDIHTGDLMLCLSCLIP